MEAERRKHEKYERSIKTLLSFSGLWIETHPIVKSTLACTALLTNFTVAVGVLNFCLHHSSNIIILTKGMSMMISLFTTCLKVTLFIHYKNDLTYLKQNLTARFFEDLKDPENRPRLLSRVSLYSRFRWVATVAVFSATSMYAVISLVAYLKHGKYARMFPAIYPFVGKPAGLSHWFFYAFELTAGFFLSSVTSGVDCCFGMYSLQMCGELRVLGSKFENLKAASDYKSKIRDCIERHQMLYNSKKKLENLFGVIAIWFAVTAAVVLCALIFQFSRAVQTNESLLQFNLLILYIILKILQGFSFSYYGNNISEESISCLDSMYNAAWPETPDKNFRTDIIIILSQRPLRLEAEGCMYIQLDMFAKIMNTSISYFFLLQTLEEGSQ